jgi:hypothetical protein
MADELVPVGPTSNKKRLRDMGDSSVSEVVAAVPIGAANLTTSQVAPATSATTLAVARPTRTSVTILNTGTTVVYVGPATVSAVNGALLPPGASRTFTTQVLIQGISIGATGACDVADEYN